MHEAQKVPLCNLRACVHLARSAALRQDHTRARLLCKLGRAAGRQHAQLARAEEGSEVSSAGWISLPHSKSKECFQKHS